jgi:hypothetical protein
VDILGHSYNLGNIHKGAYASVAWVGRALGMVDKVDKQQMVDDMAQVWVHDDSVLEG